MYVIDNIFNDIYRYIKVPIEGKHIVRVHTKKLDNLGDLSFPLNIKKLYNLAAKDCCDKIQNDQIKSSQVVESTNFTTESIDTELNDVSSRWFVKMNKNIFKNNNIHIYFERNDVFKIASMQCFSMETNYGAISRDFKIETDVSIVEFQERCTNGLSLSNLRMLLLKEVIQNITAFQINDLNNDQKIVKHISIVLTCKQKNNENEVACGFVSSDCGDIFAENLFKKRSTDMRLMAEHKYGVRMQGSQTKTEYFEKLGKAAVTLELLQNKPRKNMKITFSHPSSANKDASFVLYNCARLSALFRDFNEKVRNNVYPELVPLENVDFSLLNQAEEWELFYVYVVQYPAVLKSCIKDIEKGIINIHYLVSFLCNLCSVFSVYYRRVRILGAPMAHLIPVLHARIYLLKSLQVVFHKTLILLNIDPIQNM